MKRNVLVVLSLAAAWALGFTASRSPVSAQAVSHQRSHVQVVAPDFSTVGFFDTRSGKVYWYKGDGEGPWRVTQPRSWASR